MQESRLPESSDLALSANEFIQVERDHYAALRRLSMEQRGRMIEAACQTAAEIQCGRLSSGLPPTQPTPWPASTLAFLSKYAPHGRK